MRTVLLHNRLEPFLPVPRIVKDAETFNWISTIRSLSPR